MFTHSLLRRTAIRANAVRAFSSSGGGGGSGGGGATPQLMALAALTGVAYALYETRQQNALLAETVKELQVDLAGKTNSAFVFIKPHACKGTPGKVEAVVEEKFRASGIRITGKGEMTAEQIDANLYIDTHYGAIASKAVKLQPKELNVPDQGKRDFEQLFGESWDSALAAGKIYNAKDAATQLGLDSAGINDKWSALKPGTNLIKFGGGFYCGKMGDIYVMNGFYMSMRAAYCNPGEKIQWYTVSWPADSLSWQDFRGQVLGATNPSAAPVGSIRRTILDKYRDLGLTTKPNTGDNGVHASASPFEALAERMNWLGADMEQDLFGKGLLAKLDDDVSTEGGGGGDWMAIVRGKGFMANKNVSKSTIMTWAGDAQVSVEGETKPGKTMSLFDTLEDLDADTILDKVAKISK